METVLFISKDVIKIKLYNAVILIYKMKYILDLPVSGRILKTIKFL